jgi:hypothetical protein
MRTARKAFVLGEDSSEKGIRSLPWTPHSLQSNSNSSKYHNHVLHYQDWEQISAMFEWILNAVSVVHTNVPTETAMSIRWNMPGSVPNLDSGAHDDREPSHIASCHASNVSKTFKFVVVCCLLSLYMSIGLDMKRSYAQIVANLDALKEVR